VTTHYFVDFAGRFLGSVEEARFRSAGPNYRQTTGQSTARLLGIGSSLLVLANQRRPNHPAPGDQYRWFIVHKHIDACAVFIIFFFWRAS